MHAGAVVARPEDATWTGVVVPWCPACCTPEADPAALPAGSRVVEASTWGTATAAWRTLPVPAAPACAHFALGACVRSSPAMVTFGLATPAALGPWLGRHHSRVVVAVSSPAQKGRQAVQLSIIDRDQF
jgi:hypothetical protein